MNNTISHMDMANFEAYLYREERSNNTISKYLRDLRNYTIFLSGRQVSKENLLEWKHFLLKTYAPSSVNSMLAAVNCYLKFADLSQLSVKPVKLQYEMFTRQERELSREEYVRLVRVAEEGQNRRLSLLLQTICATGIRVSEVCYITVEAVNNGRAAVDCKGKTRIILFPLELRTILNRYCQEQQIKEGVIFRTKSGHPMDRSNIWHGMKSLCKKAEIDADKVFPHNLRHLFARSYYQMERDISKLADLLGHSSITTTRIYTKESGSEHMKQLDKMGLVVL